MSDVDDREWPEPVQADIVPEGYDRLFSALSKAQAELANVQKDSDNPFFRSKYASLAAILDHVRPVLAKHGLSFIQAPHSQGDRICVRSVLGHDSGQLWESTMCMTLDVKGKPVQEAGSVITYLRRYMLAAMVGVAQEDDDGNGTTATQKPQQAAKSKPAASQPMAKAADVQVLRADIKALEIDEPAFLEWLGVPSLDNLTEAQLKIARNGVERKRRDSQEVK